MKKSNKYRKLLLAVAAIAALYAAKATGLDQGMLDELFEAGVEVIIEELPEDTDE